MSIDARRMEAARAARRLAMQTANLLPNLRDAANEGQRHFWEFSSADPLKRLGLSEIEQDREIVRLWLDCHPDDGASGEFLKVIGWVTGLVGAIEVMAKRKGYESLRELHRELESDQSEATKLRSISSSLAKLAERLEQPTPTPIAEGATRREVSNMSDAKALAPSDLNRLQRQIAADFDAIATNSTPIRAQLLHRATDAERQGVVGAPHFGTGIASVCTLGSRDFSYLTDADGRPLPSDKPISDFEGRPFVDDKGDPVTVEFPATRTLTLFGDPASVSRLRAVADRAGAILRKSPPVPNAGLSGWRAFDDGGYWWLHLFELAIGGQLPLVECRRMLWNGNASFPYDLDQLRQLSQCPSAKDHIPKSWMTELPDAWYAELPDAVHACRELANYIPAGTEERVEPMAAATGGTPIDGEARALGILVANPDWSDKRIAEAANLSRTSLYRMPKYVAAKRLLKDAGRSHRAERGRGQRDDSCDTED